ncbi:MAG: hypothetical protein K6T30_01540 [Alicyclobacillus sp.]|nr:hypothetical protein [Alicyclobacillus sp.]
MTGVYSALSTQLYAWAHYLFALILVYAAAPRVMFAAIDGTRADQAVANYARMVLYVILSGYLLVAVRLYEVIGILCVAILYVAWRQLRGSGRPAGYGSFVIAHFLDLVEYPQLLWQRLRHHVQGHAVRRPSLARVLKWPRGNVDWQRTVRWGLVCVVFGTAGFIRLYDAVAVAAPEMSDGDVTLAWTKYINERILFHDGIYPQGLYLYMATLTKFAVIDPLFVLKFTGPLVTSFTVALLYWLVCRWTGRMFGGWLSALVFGVLGWHLLGQDWSRQAATNSQEFGLLFVFPMLHFANRYLHEGRRPDLWVATAALCDAGLIHSLAYLLAVMGGIAVMASSALQDWSGAKGRLARMALGGTASGIVSLLPIGLGKALHIPMNQSASTFLTSASQGARLPVLTGFDVLGLAAAGLLLCLGCSSLLHRREGRIWWIGGLYGAMVFGLYEFGGYLTHSAVLSARTQDLWALAAALAIGLAGQAAFDGITRGRRLSQAEWIGCAVLLAGTVAWSRPNAIVPYTVQWNEDVDAYLKIDRQYRYADGSYMVVAENFEYALVLGDGYRMDPQAFLDTYDPTKPPLTRYGQAHRDTSVAAHVFLYVYKQIFEVSKDNGIYELQHPLYVQERRNQTRFVKWLAAYRRANGREAARVFYDGPHLTVYEISRETGT